MASMGEEMVLKASAVLFKNQCMRREQLFRIDLLSLTSLFKGAIFTNVLNPALILSALIFTRA